MRRNRGSIVVTATAVGFVGTLALHLSGSKTPAALAGNNNGATSTTNGSTSNRSNTPSSNAPSGSPVTTTTQPSIPSGATTTAIRNATGTMEQYGYGQLAVRVTVQGSKIVGLNVVGLQTAESYSQQLAAQVIPMLRNEVFAAQGIQINGVSGATYTSEAYAYSIQSALARLHVK